MTKINKLIITILCLVIISPMAADLYRKHQELIALDSRSVIADKYNYSILENKVQNTTKKITVFIDYKSKEHRKISTKLLSHYQADSIQFLSSSLIFGDEQQARLSYSFLFFGIDQDSIGFMFDLYESNQHENKLAINNHLTKKNIHPIYFWDIYHSLDISNIRQTFAPILNTVKPENKGAILINGKYIINLKDSSRKNPINITIDHLLKQKENNTHG